MILANDTRTVDCFDLAVVISDVPRATLQLTGVAWVNIFSH